jgi:tetratricopeptide (TPR) repeat protein
MVFHNNSGDIYNAIGDLERTKEEYEKALTIAEKLSKKDENNAGWQRDLSVSYEKLGNFYTAIGDLKRAEEQYQKALKIAEKLSKKDENNAGWERDLWVSYYKMYSFSNDLSYLKKSVKIMQEMKEKNILLPTDKQYLKDFLKILEG